MSIVLQLQTVIRSTDGREEQRPVMSLLHTQVSMPEVQAALEAVIPPLGTLVAIPPAAHEANLKGVLRRDLSSLISENAASADERVILRVIREARDEARTPNAEVYALRYEVEAV
jgi:hypothetical protein